MSSAARYFLLSDHEPRELLDQAHSPEGRLAPAAEHAAPLERRRPGRFEYTNRALIGLLRLRAALKTAQPKAGEDDLAPAKGIMIGVLLSLVFWAAAAALLWFLVRH